jgi:hypothetical protein
LAGEAVPWLAIAVRRMELDVPPLANPGNVKKYVDRFVFSAMMK